MKFNSSELYTNLVSLGVKIETEPDKLTKMCSELRAKKNISKKPGTNEEFLPKIEGKGRPLKWIPQYFMKDVLNFLGYISDTAKRQFCIKMKNKLTGALLPPKWKPYVHRWTPIYKLGLLAKFYQLESYTGGGLSEVEFITLTTYQQSLTQEDALINLKIGLKKLLDLLRQRYGVIDYVWMFEPHKSGFPHLHLVYFKKLSELDRGSLQKIWHEKYELGDKEHGLYFSPPRGSEDGLCPAGSITSIRNYLMKYVSKSLYSEAIHEYEFHGKKIPFHMTLGELLFNSILKKTKTRLWGCSRTLSKVMARPKKENSEELECIEVDQYYGLSSEERELYPDETEAEIEKHFFSVLWTKEGGLHPDTIKKWELIGSLTSLSDKDKQDAKLNGYKIESHPIPILNKHGATVSQMDNFNIYRPYWTPLGGL